MLIYIAFAAFLFDLWMGDPRTKWHPVVLIGALITKAEKRLLLPEASSRQKQCAGGILVFFVLAIVYGFFYAISYVLTFFPMWFFLGCTVFFLCFTISPRSLAKAGQEICDLVNQNDLPEARRKVGWIVGRDTENLTAPEITRATVETIAENIVDGIISPLFYFLLGGLPLAFLYRAVNTLDSMIGYKNEKYLDFGKFAARIDDIFNYIPARLTCFCILSAVFLLRLDVVQAWRSVLTDASKHPSPNGGYSEAAVAGALGIRLGGLNFYFGKPSFRAYMGRKTRELEAKDITKTIQIMYASVMLFFLFAFIVYYNFLELKFYIMTLW